MVGTKKRTVSCAVYKKASGQLSYLILEHYGVAPIEYVRHVLDGYKVGILFLGCDGPSLLSVTEAQRLVEGMKGEGILARIQAEFPWVRYDEIPKLYQKEWFTLEGDALLLKPGPVSERFECAHLPKPSGFNKDKISSTDSALLHSILSDDDVYIYDDFTESFIVTKNSNILDKIVDAAQKFNNKVTRTRTC
jgi:hypothetical protein